MKYNNFKQKGFTLIELLVVVAIIGILSSVLVAALSNGRNKGADAGIKANLKNALAQAEVFYATNTVANSTYTNVCGSTGSTVGGAKTLLEVMTAAYKAAGLTTYAVNATGTLTTATCNDSAGAWAAEVPLKYSSGSMWCVDSSGRSKIESGTSLSSSTDYTCI
jgi:prepilin-type N-terminal cleavage/methylation domain-containing protein